MTKQTFTSILLCLISFTISAQIIFEEGYFIDNTGERKEGFIKNKDWRYNPSSFSYKPSETGEAVEKQIEEVAEFGFLDGDRYIKVTTQVDMSSNNTDRLSYEPGPLWEEKTYFLKAIVEGKASLYIYESDKLLRFFYQVDEQAIEQLVYKRYYTQRPQMRTNFQFRQQLNNNLSCDQSGDFGNIAYAKNPLRKVFIKYNECNNVSFKDYNTNGDKLKFRGSIKAGVQAGALKMERVITNAPFIGFDRTLSFRFGVDLELILPFNRNKWSVIVEPTFQSVSAEQEIEGVIDLFDNKGVLEYRSVEIPLGLRYYIFLNDDWAVFLNGFYVSDIIIKSSLMLEQGADFENKRNADNFAAGLGLRFKDRFTAEFRYGGNRDIIRSFGYYSDFDTYSLIFGYQLF